MKGACNMEYRIAIRNNWWFDAGIVGLYFIASNVLANNEHSDVEITYDEDNLTIKGESESSIKILEICYKNWRTCTTISTKNKRKTGISNV